MVPRGVLNLISIVFQIFHEHRYCSRIASQTLWITLHRLVAVYLGQEFVHKLSFVSKLYTFARSLPGPSTSIPLAWLLGNTEAVHPYVPHTSTSYN